jgi:hypothetical protein
MKQKCNIFYLPFIVANRVKKLHGFHHPVHLFILCQNQIISGQCNTKDDGRDTLEAMDPLLALRPVASKTG